MWIRITSESRIRIRRLLTAGCIGHKVHLYCTVYRVQQCMSSRRNWDSPTPSLASECSPPPGTKGGGGAHSPAGEGLGESQLRRLEKRLSTPPTL
jgi:hypothetical protein